MTKKYATMQMPGWAKEELAKRPQHLERVKHLTAAPMAQSVNLLDKCSPIRNQSTEGACTGEATIKLVEFWELFYNIKPFVPRSPQFNYNMSLKLQNELGEDAGSTVPVALSVPITYGAAPESMYPFDTNGDALVMPPQNVIDIAALFKGKNAVNLNWTGQTPSQSIMAYMSANQVPLSVAVGVMSTLFNPVNGVIDLGGTDYPNEGHNITFFGYEPDPVKSGKVRFIIANSWGIDWGIQIAPFPTAGLAYMTQDYVDQCAFQAGALYYDTPPVPQNAYKITAAFAESTLALESENTLTVTTLEDGESLGDQTVTFSESFTVGVGRTQTVVTDANGQFTTTIVMGEAGTATASASWQAPDGKTYTNSASANWENIQPPVPTTEYQIVIGPFDTQAQAQDAANLITSQFHWVPKIKEV